MVQLSDRDQHEFEKAKDLLEAGPVEQGFVRSMFFGRLALEKILPFPVQDPLEARRTDALLKELDVFLKEKVDADRIDAEERIPPEVISGLGQLGVLGMTVPEAYGGGGFSHTAYCRVLEKIATHCGSTAVLVAAHQSIGLKALILMGTEEQKRRYLPDLASGRKLAAFALTEPEAGSDAANVQTRAVLSADGKHWILNGDKKFITNGALAGLMTVMARTEIEVNGEKRDKVTAFIVTPDMPGFQVVKANRSKCGIRGSWQAVLKFTDMPVPVENVLGDVGKGLKVALSVLGYGRCTLAAGCLGGAKASLEKVLVHVRQRRQFGRRLGDFHLMQKKVAEMAETIFAMESLTYLSAGQVDRHEPDLMLETAITKLFTSEAGYRVVDDALQALGGEGYMREHGLERALRDARINRIVEGATEVMVSFVALMGMKNVGEEFDQILKAARHPIDNFGRLAEFVQHGVNDVIIGPSFTGLHPRLQSLGDQLALMVRRLARDVTRTLATHQLAILDRQIVQERIAWAAIDLYAAAAVISRMQAIATGGTLENGSRSTEEIEDDLLIGTGFCLGAFRRIGLKLDELFDNRDRQLRSVAKAVLKMEEEKDGG